MLEESLWAPLASGGWPGLRQSPPHSARRLGLPLSTSSAPLRSLEWTTMDNGGGGGGGGGMLGG